MSGPTNARRAISVVAVLALYVGVQLDLTPSASQAQSSTIALSCAYVVVPVLAILCLCVRTSRALARVDIAALVAGIGFNLASFRGLASVALSGGRTDEQLFDTLGLRTLIAGHNPYTHVYPLVGSDGYGTPLFNGKTVDTFAYPPLPIEVGRILHAIYHGATSPTVLNVGVVVVLGIVAFFALPRGGRPAVTAVLFGMNPEHSLVSAGYGVVLASALMCAALYRWTSIGRDGRLGWRGYVQALLLGLSCASYQLSWVVSAFVFVALLELRRGEVGWPRALATMARYALTAVAAFVLVNLPFILANATVWARALMSVFTQKAIVNGQGWALPLLIANGGSGGIGYFTIATAVLVVVLLLILWLGLRWVAPAVTIFATLCFALSSRSQGIYLIGFWPVWLVAAATTEQDIVQRVRTAAVLTTTWLRTTTRRAIAASTLLAIPLAIFLVAVTTAPPMSVETSGVQITSGGHINWITVDVVNKSDTTLDPTYYVDNRIGITHIWKVEQGPRQLAPGQRATVVLTENSTLEPSHVASNLWVFTTIPDPTSMTATPMRFRLGQVEVYGTGSNALARAEQRCYAYVIAGHNYDCTSQIGLSQVPK